MNLARLLVIDDDVQVREMLKQMLERAGYQVMDAPNGLVGMELHRQTPAEVIITDIIMPDHEGLETIMGFRREFNDVKIIAISGGGQIGPGEYLRLAKLLGANRTFTKPFNMQELLKAIRQLLDEPSSKDQPIAK